MINLINFLADLNEAESHLGIWIDPDDDNDFVIADISSNQIIPRKGTNWKNNTIAGKICIGTLEELSFRNGRAAQVIELLCNAEANGRGTFVRHDGKQVRVCIEAVTELYAAKALDRAFQTELEEKVEPLCTQLALEAASDFLWEWKECACDERESSIPAMEHSR
ncbi:hypothetical protein [Chroococcidiopsis sp. CCMEE 29]|uniref:hypothetical protein n=1 Tax=Chroococcidiopsis sp. CCMEE 29 TaxID=155894 RepID=UPI002020A90E|nr:hypothetical protein [Chroococcidiopsis sp. CCMEE 29]